MNSTLGHIQNFGLVTLIAALIWLYAEGQDVSDVTRQISVTLPERVGQNYVIAPVEGEMPLRVNVTLKGATAPLGQAQSRLSGGTSLVLPVDANQLPSGPQGSLSLASLIARAPIDARNAASPSIEQMGVSVVSVEPADLMVNVVELVRREVPIRFRPADVQLGSGVRISPTEVEVEVPRHVIDQFGDAPDLMTVEAMIRPEQLANMPEGVTQTLTLNLRPSGVLADVKHVRLLQRNAEVTFTIERQKDTFVAALVPVWLVAPPSELKRFEVELDAQSQVLRDVSITGPRDVIQQLRQGNGQHRIIARFELTGDQLDRGVTSAPLSSIEIQQIQEGMTLVSYVVPLNPEALRPGIDPPPPTFVSPVLTVTTASPTVQFTVQRRPD